MSLIYDHRASWTAGILAIMVLLLASAASGAGASTGLDLRLYDPTARATTSVTAVDVLRSSARAGHQSDGRSFLYFRFTTTGVRKFHRLTRALAQIGTREHRFEPMVFKLDGHVYARALIDYRAYPDGLPGDEGVEFGALPFTTAQRLARRIRGR